MNVGQRGGKSSVLFTGLLDDSMQLLFQPPAAGLHRGLLLLQPLPALLQAFQLMALLCVAVTHLQHTHRRYVSCGQVNTNHVCVVILVVIHFVMMSVAVMQIVEMSVAMMPVVWMSEVVMSALLLPVVVVMPVVRSVIVINIW